MIRTDATLWRLYSPPMKLSQGDSVVIISGKDKGKKGKVLRVLVQENRVVVSDVNLVTKHIKKTPQAEGRKIRFESSIHASNVMLLDPKTGKPTRVGYRRDEKTGRKERFAKVSGIVVGRTKLETPKAKEAPVKERAVPTKKEEAAPEAKKSPFWKKIGFGSDAMADAGQGSSKPDAQVGSTTQTHSRSGSRGS